MRFRSLAASVAGVLVVAFAAPAAAAPTSMIDRLARQILPAGDGWAADGAGTTGGAAATPENVFHVTDRDELAAAVAGPDPAIVVVHGTILGNADPSGAPLSCAQFADPAYSLDAFLAAYDPAVWGRVAPSGPLEEARVRSAANQSARVRVNVGSNKTIIGAGAARLNGVFLRLDGSANVIIRNITHEDTRDCFPVWSPTDGEAGNWNAAYDNVWIRNSQHVWIDHNTFTDADNPDSAQPLHFGRPYQVHDGQVDITNGSNYVTVSWNRFTNHDKTMLIGSTNTPGADVGALKVTLHHNEFDGSVQRAPRVRFGQVDVYNNLYRVPVAEPYEYSWGVGVQSAIYAENNYVALGAGVATDAFVYDWGGTALTEVGTWVRSGWSLPRPASLLAAYNATHDPDLSPDAGWTPSLRAGPVLPAPAAALVVELCAGARRLPT
ncbi:pectate lyase [Asanoa sp. WMMD1127]|uniref:pectate lyase family protein n=1 Tax=Asanoa sp. WMMD1127 TaxID=3016107 RepID=UPI002417B10C|nr:pectate lyase [Asanoa sp. WMMD1127]MDG4823907.1 pectate lyase [Asanoa sp. WMMD1127]